MMVVTTREIWVLFFSTWSPRLDLGSTERLDSVEFQIWRQELVIEVGG